MTNSVIVQSEHFLLVSVELNQCSAFVLVPLKNTAHLRKQNHINAWKKKKAQMHIYGDDFLPTCPLCSPRTTMMVSLSLFGTTVSSMSCFTSDRNTHGTFYGHCTGVFNINKCKKLKGARPRCTSNSPSMIRPSSVRHTQEVGVSTSSTNIYGNKKVLYKGFQFKITVK